MWLWYALIAGLGMALNSLFMKYASGKIKDSWIISFYFSFICGIIILPFAIFENDFASSATNWILLIVICIIIVLNNYLTFKSYNYLNASTINIISKLRLIWILIISILFFHQTFTTNNIIGIACILIASLMVVDYSKWEVTKKGILIAIGATFTLAAFATILTTLSAQMKMYGLLFFIAMIPALMNAAIMPKFFSRIQIGWKNLILIIPIVIFGAVFNLGLIKALTFNETSKVFFVMESFLVLIVLGEYFFLKEKKNLWIKLVAVLIIILGVVLLK